MVAMRTEIGPHRDYAGSEEETSGLPPAEDQKYTGAEVSRVLVVVDSHAENIDDLEIKTKPWSLNFKGTRTWIRNDDGSVTDYHSTLSSTAAQRAVTVPGLDASVWILDDPESDPVAAFEAALV